MKKPGRSILLVICLMALCAAPALAEDVTPVAVELSFNFDRLAPGTAGMVMVTGWDVASAEATFDGRPVTFQREGESLIAFIAASLEIGRVDEYLDATVRLHSGGEVNYHLPVDVAWADWGQQNISLPSNLGYLLDPAINDAETTLLQNIYSRITPQRYWDGPFALPPVRRNHVAFWRVPRLQRQFHLAPHRAGHPRRHRDANLCLGGRPGGARRAPRYSRQHGHHRPRVGCVHRLLPPLGDHGEARPVARSRAAHRVERQHGPQHRAAPPLGDGGGRRVDRPAQLDRTGLTHDQIDARQLTRVSFLGFAKRRFEQIGAQRCCALTFWFVIGL
ncbi:MAG: hypothetical protein M5R40_26680 [Anaerolineae bacterium]|nr:hypothetical protein [Anaerolineae bacterium]